MNLVAFETTGFKVRTINDDRGVWFVAKDVCEALGISKYRDAIAKLDDDERVSKRVDTLGGVQEMVSVNESGLYALIFRSNKPEARKFRKWVTSEVLPAIRKYGGYGNSCESVKRDIEEFKEFVSVTLSNYASICNENSRLTEQAKKLRAQVKGLNAKLRKTKEYECGVTPRKEKHYTRDEEKMILSLLNAGNSIRVIAGIMGRSYSSMIKKINRMGIRARGGCYVAEGR